MIRYRDLSIRLTAILTLSLITVLPVHSQVTTSDVTGRVTDEQGRVVSGATVTASRQGTGAVRTTTTNDSGEYTITQLPPGKYDLTLRLRTSARLWRRTSS